MQRSVYENRDRSLEMTKHDATHFVEQNMIEELHFVSNFLVRRDNPILWVALAETNEECERPMRNTITSPASKHQRVPRTVAWFSTIDHHWGKAHFAGAH